MKIKITWVKTKCFLSLQVLRRDLTNAIRKKRPGVAIEELLLHQDNAHSHRATDTLMTIDFLGYERIYHAPYSPDLAPMDFAVFPRLKSELRGRRFETLEELRLAVRSEVGRFESEWYLTVYQKWV